MGHIAGLILLDLCNPRLRLDVLNKRAVIYVTVIPVFCAPLLEETGQKKQVCSMPNSLIFLKADFLRESLNSLETDRVSFAGQRV